MKKISLLFLGWAVFFSGQAQTTVPSLITTNQVWTLSGSPYLVNQNTYISAGVTVKVMPGVEITGSAKYTLSIDGEFQAVGKWDTMINISKTEFNFSSKSLDYNASTGRGALFKYCNIKGNGSGSNTISTTSTSIKVDNCVITNTYTAFYMGGSDSVTHEFTNCKFLGDPKISGSPIYSYNMSSKNIVTNCYISNMDNIHLYGSLIFKDNVLTKTRVTYLFLTGYSEFTCNKFSNMSNGLGIDLYGSSTKDKLYFKNNTLDSMGSSINYPMFNLTKNGSNNKLGPIEVNNNNFLRNMGTAQKVIIGGVNQIFTKTDTVNFKDNYWGTSDSTTIEGYIKDYNDDINIYGRVNFLPLKNAPVTGCSYNNNCTRANFKYTVQDDSIVTFKDSSFGSRPYKVKWKFGDGNHNDSNKKTVVHLFLKPGAFMVCLYVYDTANNFCDSMCRVIVIKSKTRCNASFYFALDTTKPNYVYIINSSKGINNKTKYYWTFGDGTGSSATNPSHTYGSSGKYQLCLTIFDTSAGCYSTFCDSVEINANGLVLLVLNEKDVTGILSHEVYSAVSAFPNPSKGNVTLNLSTNKENEVSIDIMNIQGQVLRTTKYEAGTGYNEISMDLNDLSNGIYYINVHSPDFTKTIKVVLNK